MPHPVTVEDLVQFHDELGIDRAVIVQASPQGTDNTCLTDTLDVLRAMGREARGVAVVKEETDERELLQLHEAGVRGLRVNLQTFGISTPETAAQRLRSTARMAAFMGWHVQIYTQLTVVSALAETIASLDVPVVVDHYGLAHSAHGVEQQGFSALLNLLDGGNVYVKLSAPYRIIDHPLGDDGRAIARALIERNIDRMLWGTDWPHTNPPPGVPRPRHHPEALKLVDDGHQLNIFARWTSAEERQKIMVDNAARLYEFPVVPIAATPTSAVGADA
jgi:predicted TIM-barrel fold metal-dependent hydrolase